MFTTLNGKEGKVSKIEAQNTELMVGSEVEVLVQGLSTTDFSRGMFVNFV